MLWIVSSKAKMARSLARGRATEPLSREDRERALSRFRSLEARSTHFGFAPLLTTTFEASNPAELEAAAEEHLANRARGRRLN
jgi:hypothetical protein